MNGKHTAVIEKLYVTRQHSVERIPPPRYTEI